MTPIELALLDWRRATAALYARVRGAVTPAEGHEIWRLGRDVMFREYEQSPLSGDDPLRASGLPYAPYDAALRFEVDVAPPVREETLTVDSSNDGAIRLRLAGHVAVPEPLGVRLDVWWLAQYGGGLFLPVRDATAGQQSYGGGRYLLDTVKGADLGRHGGQLTLDFNFLYHPSCRYDPRWECPLAPPGNTVDVGIHAGEIL